MAGGWWAALVAARRVAARNRDAGLGDGFTSVELASLERTPWRGRPNAVHVASAYISKLRKWGYVAFVGRDERKTNGRPAGVYTLTDKGRAAKQPKGSLAPLREKPENALGRLLGRVQSSKSTPDIEAASAKFLATLEAFHEIGLVSVVEAKAWRAGLKEESRRGRTP